MKPLMISRRRLIQATVVVSGAVPLGLLATRKLAAHLRSSRNRPGQTRTILNRPLKVPPDFLGMHFHRWPAGTPLSPPPNFDFGAVRSHDYSVPWYSIHLTPGSCYDEASNGNKSDIHWDLVMRQTPEVGGGEIWFDGRVVRKDGMFVVEELQGLNPENLK